MKRGSGTDPKSSTLNPVDSAGAGGNADQVPLPANQLLAGARRLARECKRLGDQIERTCGDLRLASLAWRTSGELLAIGDVLRDRYVDRDE